MKQFFSLFLSHTLCDTYYLKKSSTAEIAQNCGNTTEATTLLQQFIKKKQNNLQWSFAQVATTLFQQFLNKGFIHYFLLHTSSPSPFFPANEMCVSPSSPLTFNVIFFYFFLFFFCCKLFQLFFKKKKKKKSAHFHCDRYASPSFVPSFPHIPFSSQKKRKNK